MAMLVITRGYGKKLSRMVQKSSSKVGDEDWWNPNALPSNMNKTCKFSAKNWAAPSKLRDHFVLTNNKYHPSDTLQQTNTCEKPTVSQSISSTNDVLFTLVFPISLRICQGVPHSIYKKSIYNPICTICINMCYINYSCFLYDLYLLYTSPLVDSYCDLYGCGFPPPCLDHFPREKP
jgi:hypothetical protein